MSHGGGGGTEVKAEPNLTPLLDLVLQLVMFFLLVANFSVVSANKDIVLPKAQSARPVIKETDVRYLNVVSEDPKKGWKNGDVLVLGRREPLRTLVEIEVYLKDEANLIRKRLKDEGKGEELQTVIVIRADERVDYKPVYDVMQTCKNAGFRKLQLNAMTSAGKR